MNAKELYELQAIENDGRGVSCVRTICTYLDIGDVSSANAVLRNEFDKIRNYENIVSYLKKQIWVSDISGLD